MSIKAFVYGYDGVGWSVDADRYYTEKLLLEAGICIVDNPFKADVIHFVWWNQAKPFRYLKKITRAKWLAVVTNTIREDTAGYLKLGPYVDCWVAANFSQYNWFLSKKVTCGYQPFYVDERVFHPVALKKEQICRYLGINFQVVRNKILIGSFQRDSLGSDLNKPKWQKGPDMLVNLMRGISVPRENWCLVLAGPRRHWIVNQCETLGIPYVFMGDIPKEEQDDYRINTLSREVMALLYNLIDIYVVSSKMEGGPKAIIETAFCQTPIISTRVGLAPDMLVEDALIENVPQGVELLERLINNEKERRKLAYENYNKTYRAANRQICVARWKSIYRDLLK